MNDPLWIASREKQDWCDDDLLRAVVWLKGFVPADDMRRRLEGARAFLLEAREKFANGEDATYYDPRDTVAWYILQAETYATDRKLIVPDAAPRFVPFLTKLGQELPAVLSIEGAEARAARIMLAEKGQPDSGIFELMVALAYRNRGWSNVAFVPEQPGVARTPDLLVSRPRKRWAVECKRLMPSTYATAERLRGMQLAAPVHRLSLELARSIIVEVKFDIELKDVPDDYLAVRVADAINRETATPWRDGVGTGRVRPIDWTLARAVLKHDYIYFGSSRMIELLKGVYEHGADHSMAAKWRPVPDRPFFADALYHASVVSWISRSEAANRRKARHFKSTLADAEGQLPGDRPGAVHIGIETGPSPDVAATRHIRNLVEARFFEPSRSRLRWVYGNHFVPENTTNQNESCAITETTIPYQVGSHRTAAPLAHHFLVAPDDSLRSGPFWHQRSR